jgi:hypothetical protein
MLLLCVNHSLTRFGGGVFRFQEIDAEAGQPARFPGAGLAHDVAGVIVVIGGITVLFLLRVMWSRGVV